MRLGLVKIIKEIAPYFITSISTSYCIITLFWSLSRKEPHHLGRAGAAQLYGSRSDRLGFHFYFTLKITKFLIVLLFQSHIL
jgi:hypothetical protein